MEENNMQQAMSMEQIDERIEQAVLQARSEWERAQEENQRVAAMTQEERAGYELSRREAELAERERALVKRELKAMALEELSARGLPTELCDALSYDSEAECFKSMDKLEHAFRQAVQGAVDERLRGQSPSVGAGRRADAEALSDAEYYRMNTKFGA